MQVDGKGELALLAANLRGAGLAMATRATGVQRHYGQLILTQIRANASGRPGPRAITGDYRRSWGIATGPRGSTIVGTNKPQARRLEWGFTGTDSLGRRYRQPPFPHVGPAVKKYEDSYMRAMQGEAVASVEAAVGRSKRLSQSKAAKATRARIARRAGP